MTASLFPLSPLALSTARLIVHSPRRALASSCACLIAPCSAQAGRWVSTSLAPRPPRSTNDDATARRHLLPDHTSDPDLRG